MFDKTYPEIPRYARKFNDIPKTPPRNQTNNILADVNIEILRDEAWNLSQQLSLILNSQLDERNLEMAERKASEIKDIITKMKGSVENE